MTKEALTLAVIENSLNSRKGNVHDFGEMGSLLPDHLRKKEINFLKIYFRGQLWIKKGRKNKAKEIFNGLDKKTGWKEFEKENGSILALIDLAVRGETTRLEDRFQRGVGRPGVNA